VSLSVGADGSVATWAGTILPEDARVLLVLDGPDQLWPVTWDLLRIGYQTPVGWLAGGLDAWRTAAEPLEELPQVRVHELRDRLEAGEVNLLDVRQPAEWASGRAPGARFITGAELPERLDEVPTDKPLAVACGSGYRSSVAASVIAAGGRVPVLNVLGGMAAWKSADYLLH
jgi:hydroxyacylglutathione hydrolase